MAKADLNKILVEDGVYMIGTELKFEDEYINNKATYFESYAKELQEGINSYLSIMHNIRDNAIMEGDTAKALDTFIMYADKLKEIIEQSGTNAKTVCENFVDIVDKKDDKFY